MRIVAADRAVARLNARAAGPAARPSETIHLAKSRAARGIESCTSRPPSTTKVKHIGALAAMASDCVGHRRRQTRLAGPLLPKAHGWSKNALYRNNHAGTFNDVAEAPGLPFSLGPVKGRIDGCGVGRIRQRRPRRQCALKVGLPQLFHNLGPLQFEDRHGAVGVRTGCTQTAGVGSLPDRGRLLDLSITVFPVDIELWAPTQNLKSRHMRIAGEFASKGGQRPLLFKNCGNANQGRTEAMGVGRTRWTSRVRRPISTLDGGPISTRQTDYGPEELLNKAGSCFEAVRPGPATTPRAAWGRHRRRL